MRPVFGSGEDWNIRGHQGRYAAAGEMLAHFTSMIIAPNYKKGRAPKAADLWKTPGRERQREERQAAKEKVVSLDDRRRERKDRGQEFTKLGAPVSVRRKG